MSTHTHSPPLLWVRYEARPVLLTTLGLDRLAELAHRRLCDSIWATGELPLATGDSPRRLARLTAREWQHAWKELHAFGWRSSSGRLSHPWPLQLLKEAQKFRRDRRETGLRGGRPPKPSSPANPPPADSKLAPSPADALAQANPKVTLASPEANSNVSSKSPDGHPNPVTVQYSNSTVPYALNEAERLTCSALPRAKLSVREKAFMGAVRELFTTYSPAVGHQELENWGGWWRNRFRESPDKAQRVLADIGSMMKEGTIQSNPGAAATDLWNRLP